MNDIDWEELRAEALEYARNLEQTVIKKWLNEIGYNYKEPIGYYKNLRDKTMEIYTTRPGMLIGKAGINVDKFKKILSEEFRGEWKVKFIEIRGGFVNL